MESRVKVGGANKCLSLVVIRLIVRNIKEAVEGGTRGMRKSFGKGTSSFWTL